MPELKINQVVTILRDRLASLLGLTHHGTRDLYENFGWPKNLIIEQLFAMYYRGGIANRIIKAYPQATWRDIPVIRDEQGSSSKKDAADYSPFTESVEQFFKKHNVLAYLERADRVAGVGRFSLLLFGFRDGLPLDQPMAETSSQAPLLYLSVYADPNVTITEWEQNMQDPRFGKPKYYTVQTGNPVVGGGQSNAIGHRSFRVHWSRVLHLAEYLDEDEIYGLPRLVSVYNYVQDLEKLTGAGAESFWFNARGGMVWSADKDAQFGADEITRMERQAEEFGNQLRRITALQGVTPTQLNSTIIDPSPLINSLLDLIAGGVAIPKRILVGTERGELSSDQDENNWAQRVEERRVNYASPYILKPMISKLILTGNVLQPKGQWEIQWPGAGLGPQKAAEVGSVRSNTLRNYVTSPGAELVVPPEEFRKEFLGLEPVSEYADSVVEEPLDEEELALLEEPPAEAEGEVANDDAPPGDQLARLSAAEMQKASGTGQRLVMNAAQLHAFRTSPFGQDFLKANTISKSLYIYRPVLNADDIMEWAREQGFSSVMGPDEMHVTMLYCESPVDWFAMPDDWAQNEDGEKIIQPGGARMVEQLGSACVLRFKNEQLEWRHKAMLDAGASHKHVGSFMPHVTITYDMDGLDYSEIEPYRGKIVLGPEVFAEVDREWKDRVQETTV